MHLDVQVIVYTSIHM